LLAKNLNDNAHWQGIGGALEIIASKLAPTGSPPLLWSSAPVARIGTPRLC